MPSPSTPPPHPPGRNPAQPPRGRTRWTRDIHCRAVVEACGAAARTWLYLLGVWSPNREYRAHLVTLGRRMDCDWRTVRRHLLCLHDQGFIDFVPGDRVQDGNGQWSYAASSITLLGHLDQVEQRRIERGAERLRGVPAGNSGRSAEEPKESASPSVSPETPLTGDTSTGSTEVETTEAPPPGKDLKDTPSTPTCPILAIIHCHGGCIEHPTLGDLTEDWYRKLAQARLETVQDIEQALAEAGKHLARGFLPSRSVPYLVSTRSALDAEHAREQSRRCAAAEQQAEEQRRWYEAIAEGLRNARMGSAATRVLGVLEELRSGGEVTETRVADWVTEVLPQRCHEWRMADAAAEAAGAQKSQVLETRRAAVAVDDQVLSLTGQLAAAACEVAAVPIDAVYGTKDSRRRAGVYIPIDQWPGWGILHRVAPHLEALEDHCRSQMLLAPQESSGIYRDALSALDRLREHGYVDWLPVLREGVPGRECLTAVRPPTGAVKSSRSEDFAA